MPFSFKFLMLDLPSSWTEPWIDEPAVLLRWCDLPPLLSRELLVRIDATEPSGQSAAFTARHAIQRVRIAGLSFLPLHVAIEVQVGAYAGMPGSAASIASFVFGPGGATPLDGTSVPIFSLTRRHMSLFDGDTTLDYLRFFCAHVRGEDGPFRTVERMADIGFAPRSKPETRKKVADLLHPLKLVSLDPEEDGGTAVIEAMVLYSDTLFRSVFSISLQDGATSMIDDEPLVSNIPVRSLVYQGHYRAPVALKPAGSRIDQ